jgi:hypothetical protein
MRHPKFVILALLCFGSIYSFSQIDCKKYSQKRGVQKKYGDWLSKRTNSEDIIGKLKTLQDQGLITGAESDPYKSQYMSYSGNLNGILNEVKAKILNDDLGAVIVGANLTAIYKAKFTPVLDSLENLNQRMIAFHNERSPKPHSAADSGDALIAILLQILPHISEYVKAVRIEKVNCLEWKQWDTIK